MNNNQYNQFQNQNSNNYSNQGQFQNNYINHIPPFQQPSFLPQKPPTAEQEFKKLVSDFKQQKEAEKQVKEQEIFYDIPKCSLHPQKQSLNCRTCKKNKALFDEFESKREEQQKKEPQIESFSQEITTNNLYNANNTYIKIDKSMKIFPIWGDSSSYNINPLLRNNILSSQYFKDLYLLKTYHEVIDEICKKSTHVEPWAPGSNGIPSTLFCCLYKFMLMKMTIKQVKGLLEYKGNTYVRCVGFLYIRYCCDPEYLWDWLAKYLLDDEELHPSADPKVATTMGEYVENLIIDMNYYQTRFPRIPVMIDRTLRAKIMLMREKRDRKRINIENIHLFQKGMRVKALSNQDNEWHNGIIERVDGKNVRVKFILEDPGVFGEGIMKLNMLEEQFRGNSVFYGGEEFVSFADIYIVNEEEEEEERMLKIQALEQKQREKYPELEKKEEEQQKSKSKEKKEEDKSSNSSKSSKKHRKNKHHHHKHHHKSHHHKKEKRKESSSERNSASRSRSRSRSLNKEKRNQKNAKIEQKLTDEERYLEEVRRREKNEALANCKADYSKRPTSYKTSLSNPLPSGSTRTRSRSPSPIRKRETFIETSGPRYEESKENPSKKSQLSHEYILRMRKLKETYGDASANASLLNKLNAKKEGGTETKKRLQLTGPNETGLGMEDVVKLGN